MFPNTARYVAVGIVLAHLVAWIEKPGRVQWLIAEARYRQVERDRWADDGGPSSE